MNNPTDSPKLASILLAAGPSTRLGQPKQLVRIDGEDLVRKTARLLIAQEPTSVTVVTGCESDGVEQALAGLPVRTVLNRNWEKGMGSSINCGVRSLNENLDGVLLMVVDQWCLQAEDISRLIDHWSGDISRIVTACWHEGKAFVSGPPAIFPRKLIPELKYVLENRGARQVIDRHIDIVEFVPMENAAFDLDRPEDLERLHPGI